MDWLYVETSALLELVLDQPRATEILQYMQHARALAASELLVLEMSRVIARLGKDTGAVVERLAYLERFVDLCPVDVNLRAHLARPFASEPLRTLDALHLATALDLRLPGERVGFLCLDKRLRENAAALGFVVMPHA